MNKRGFDSAFCAPFFALSSLLSLALFPLFSSVPLRFLTVLFSFFLLVPCRSRTTYLSHISRLPVYISSTPLHHEVQLRFIPGKFIYIFLDSFTFQKIYITISFLICLMHISRSTKTCIAFLHYWLPGE